MGATTVLAILLSPIANTSQHTVDSLDDIKGSVGSAILRFYMDAVERQLLIYKELSNACVAYPTANILGIVPDHVVGDVTDFYTEKLKAMNQYGRERALQSGFVDLCAAAGLSRYPNLENDMINSNGSLHLSASSLVGIGLACACVGALGGMFAMKHHTRLQEGQQKQHPHHRRHHSDDSPQSERVVKKPKSLRVSFASTVVPISADVTAPFALQTDSDQIS